MAHSHETRTAQQCTQNTQLLDPNPDPRAEPPNSLG